MHMRRMMRGTFHIPSNAKNCRLNLSGINWFASSRTVVHPALFSHRYHNPSIRCHSSRSKASKQRTVVAVRPQQQEQLQMQQQEPAVQRASNLISKGNVVPQPVFPPFRTARVSFAHGDATRAESYQSLLDAVEDGLPRSSSSSTTTTTTTSRTEKGALSRRRMVDLVLTDPPYCLLSPRNKSETSSSSPSSTRESTPRKKLLHDPTGASSTLRFSSTRDYRNFTQQWLQGLLPYLSPGAPLVIWTNFLGKSPILDAVRSTLAGYEMWNEFLWLKPNKPPLDSMKQRSKNIQHSIAPVSASAAASPNTSSIITTATSFESYPPDLTLPPLPLSLTSAEQAFRCYEVALIFGKGKVQDSPFHARQLSMPNYVVCPYEEHDDQPSSNTPSHTAATSSSSLLLHPNAKPPRVLLPLLRCYSEPNSLVLDPFAGSAAHAVTALRANRCVATIEANDFWARHMQHQLMKASNSLL